MMMRAMTFATTQTSVFVGGLVVASGLLLAEPALAVDGSQAWSSAQDTVIDIYDQRAEESFATDNLAEARRQRIARLLDKAVEILSTSELDSERRKITELTQAISDLKKQIREDRFKMASAPEASDDFMSSLGETLSFGLVNPTKATYRTRIEEAEKEIALREEEISGVKQSFQEELAKMGVNLDARQIEGLLSMATGDSMVQIMAAFENMRAITDHLMESTVATDESIEVAQRYYGIYTVMLEIAAYMHVDFIRQVDDVYLVHLSEIVEETGEVRQEAQSLLARERDQSMRRVLENNVASQNLTLKAAEVYKQRLKEQKASIKASLGKIKAKLRVARNTYRTVTLSSELVGMLRSSSETFEAIMKIQIPELRPFESIEMQREFDRLTEEMKAPTS